MHSIITLQKLQHHPIILFWICVKNFPNLFQKFFLSFCAVSKKLEAGEKKFYSFYAFMYAAVAIINLSSLSVLQTLIRKIVQKAMNGDRRKNLRRR